MTNLNTRTLNTYEEANSKFLDKAFSLMPYYDKVPTEKYCSERMGGWLIKDSDNMMIGWVGNLGEVTVYDYEPTTKENANSKNFRGVK